LLARVVKALSNIRQNADERHHERKYATLRAPALSIRPTGTAAGSTVCLGDVITIVWILGR